MARPTLQVLLTCPERVLFDGTAGSVILPGEVGTFEVLPFHRPLVSRLMAGPVTVDERSMAIVRGIVRVADNVVTAVVELP
jgi:F0F1-type ATP synthase epsilon subunit